MLITLYQTYVFFQSKNIIDENYLTNTIYYTTVSWTWKRGFYMLKLSYEDKINIYNNKKEEMSIKALLKNMM